MSELPNGLNSEAEALRILNRASIAQNEDDLYWVSSDKRFTYYAYAPFRYEQGVEEPDFERVMMSSWSVCRINMARITFNATYEMTQYFLSQETPLDVIEWEAPVSWQHPQVDDPIGQLEADRSIAAAVDSTEPPGIHDYANLDNAIYDLAWQSELKRDLEDDHSSITEDSTRELIEEILQALQFPDADETK